MYKEIDNAVRIWISQFLVINQILRGDIIQIKAKQFAFRFGLTGFIASAGWITNFKRRNNVCSYIKLGEAASMPSLEKINKYREKIAEKLSEYATEQSKTLAQGPVTETKKSKNRVTILLTCNTTDENDLNDAMQKLSYDDTLSVLEYFNADKLSENEVLLDDDKIVKTVRPRLNTEETQDDEDEFVPNISLSNALNSIENLITFQNFLPENYEVTNDELKILKGIRRKVLKFKSESALQLNLNEFVIFE
ncbi:4433_t:CDS:2 [Funneliformis geosporum]|nr:4433_t:CDS:2 [Funneliformis geosporum]